MHYPKASMASALVVVFACSATPALAQKSKDTLRYPIPQADPNFDRYTSPGSLSTGWSPSVFDDLLGFDTRTSTFAPRLAKSWSQPDDVTYEYDLREDVRWHDGQPVTADDVVYTMTWLADPNSKLRFKENWTWVKSIEKLGPLKVRITAKQPTPDGLIKMASGWPIYPRHAHEPLANKTDFAEKPVGTGPYKISKIDKTGIIAEKYVGYRATELKPAASIGHVIAEPIPDAGTLVAALLTDKADLAANIPGDQAADLEKSGKFEVTLSPPDLGYVFITFPSSGWQNAKQFADPRVRLAMAKAIDRQALVKLTYGALTHQVSVVEGLCSKAQLGCGFTRTVPDYDPAGAKRLLAEAGYSEGFETTISVFPKQVSEATAIAGMLRAVGVRASVTPHPVSRRIQLIQQGKIEMGYYGWSGGGTFDVAPQIVRHFGSGDYADASLNTAAIAAMSIVEDAKRRSAVAKVFDEVHDKAYAFPMLPIRDSFTHTKEVKLNVDQSRVRDNVAIHDFAWK